MMLTVGAKIVYPCRGPCVIGPIVHKLIGGQTRKFYPLALLDDTKGELFVPVENLADLHIRALLDKSEIPAVLRRLKQTTTTNNNPKAAKNWRQRNTDIAKLFSSGSAFDLAEIVESLSNLGQAKSLSAHERDTLGRARKLLVCEIAEVTGESKTAVEEQVTDALHIGKSV
jgi:RNA polymerase-interacting CarD/CdnL/TRCF family regulator